MGDPAHGYVSRGGLKLEHALDAFAIDPTGLWCADLGASTGGFTDCLLKRGAPRVFSVETGYGVLDYTLRIDPRVVVMERTNAAHAEPHPDALAHAGVALVVIDLGWTPQRLAIPAALRWLAPGGRIVSLVKPHYEAKEQNEPVPRGGVLGDDDAERILARTLGAMEDLGVCVGGCVESPIRGSRGKRTGNREWLALLSPRDATRPARAPGASTAPRADRAGPGSSRR